MKTLNDAFEHTRQAIYYAENALTKALPKMANVTVQQGRGGKQSFAAA